MIRLETSKRNGIDNTQSFDISAFERNWSAEIPKKYPKAKQRTEMSALYNCHGLTFASRRTRITEHRSIERILTDDNWDQIGLKEILPGDVVIYYSEEGDRNHSGIILECNELGIPTICSKWGNAGEYIHLLTDHPPFYGPNKRFYRFRL